MQLISDFRSDRPIAQRAGRLISQQEALQAVLSLSRQLRTEQPVINLCDDRYHFTLLFAAAAVAGSHCLLPAARSQVAGPEIQTLAGNALSLSDAWVEQRLAAPGRNGGALPCISEDSLAALMFTSGSTGVPTAHAKRWGQLSKGTAMFRQRLLQDLNQPGIVATVPPQHMYGLETSVLPALFAGACVHAGRPRMPWDIADALAEMSAPRVLVTTPVHIRACLRADVDLPELACIISATAPLDTDLAVQAQGRWHTRVREIYGCTEAGSLASRTTANEASWTLYPGMRLSGSEPALLDGPQLDESVALADRIEYDPDGRFRLKGRRGDLIKLAGKRMAMGELTQRLLAVTGVEDAVVFRPRAEANEEQRPAALVVAPGLSAREVAAALAPSIDPVFVPRPLLCTDRLPRNAVGKLPRAMLQVAFDQAMNQADGEAAGRPAGQGQ